MSTLQRKALEKASELGPSVKLPPWQENKNMMQWLQSL